MIGIYICTLYLLMSSILPSLFYLAFETIAINIKVLVVLVVEGLVPVLISWKKLVFSKLYTDTDIAPLNWLAISDTLSQ